MKKKAYIIILAMILIFSPANKSFAFDADDFANIGQFYNDLSKKYTDFLEKNKLIKDLANSAKVIVQKKLSNSALLNITNSSVNWINSGYSDWGASGEPFYLTDPNSFFKNLADKEINKIVDEIAFNPEKNPYGASIAQDVINASLDNFDDKFTFTLEKTIGDKWEDFEDDFTVGGWNGYLDFITNPANNPIGAALLVQDELTKRQSTEVANTERELSNSDGGGFLSLKECVKWKDDSPPEDIDGYTFDILSEFGISDSCEEYRTTTPGSVISNTLSAVTQTTFENINLKNALGGDLISSLIDNLFTKILTDGLNYITNSVNIGENYITENYLGQDILATIGNIDIPGVETLNLQEIFEGQLDLETLIYDTSNTPEQYTLDELETVNEILALSKQIPVLLKDLDGCIPGPSYGWEQRFDEALNRTISTILQDDSSVYNNIQTSAKLVKSMIKNRYLYSGANIPSASSMNYIIGSTISNTNPGQYEQTLGNKSLALSRLNNLKNEYLSTPPTDQEALNQIAISYLAIEESLSDTSTLQNTENTKKQLQDDIDYISSLINQCQTEKNTNTFWDDDGDFDTNGDYLADIKVDLYGDYIPDGNGVMSAPHVVDLGFVASPTGYSALTFPLQTNSSITNEIYFYCQSIVNDKINSKLLEYHGDFVYGLGQNLKCLEFYFGDVYDYE
ncbi:hypothetical protein H6790_00625 [Candidatus Nomurabacteria bacterium]|nr:hypothetical protein [Candidatus Nomurabacteria bacterium]MCB9820437.1 hypothetical protein [Candidatus Nomurabacteria bacterium]